jgi:Metallo-peptidase family M12B Reprolysin-like
MALMRVRNRQMLIPAVVLVGLWVTTVPTATASVSPAPEAVTGIVQTVVVEQPREEALAENANATDGDITAGDNADPNVPAAGVTGADTDTNVTVKVLRAGTRVVPLAEGSLPTTRDGTTVAVTVVPGEDGTKRVLSATTISAPVAAAVPAAHNVYLALVVPRGVTAESSLTSASARAMVERVSRYWSDQTGGQVSFAATRVVAYTSAYSCAQTYNLWDEAQSRMPEASGPGRHLVVVVPSRATALGCAYGLGTVGAVRASGNLVLVSGLNQSLLAHELGHNLGLYHSNSLQCGGAQDMTVVNRAFPGCQAKAYDDLFDVMGYSGTSYGEGNLNAVHLDGMRLLPSAVRKIAAGSGVTTARITPLSTTTDNRTLKVTDAGGVSYFVEYRTDSGRDRVGASNPWQPAWGVRVLREDPTAPASAGSYELDATPTRSAEDYNRSIPVGGTFTAASRKLSIVVNAADATGATLTIANSATAVAPSTATMSVPARALVGAAITASTTVTDSHARAVANWPVTVQKLQRGTTTWRSVRTLTTTATGGASYRFANGLSGYYRWVTAPGPGTPARFSRTVAVTSTARVVQVRPASSMTRGRYLTVTGRLSPVPAPVVYIQYRYPGGTWLNGPRASVRGTAVSGRILLRARTTAYTRLYVRAATPYAGSTSGYYATKVT